MEMGGGVQRRDIKNDIVHFSEQMMLDVVIEAVARFLPIRTLPMLSVVG